MPGGMNMGGPGFRVYSTGFGPGGGMQFNQQGRRRPQQQQRAGGGGRAQQGQNQPPTWQGLVQFIPLLILFVLSFMSSPDESGTTHTGGSQYFSLTRSPPYVHMLETRLATVKDIPYYVTDKFLRSYKRDRYALAQVERMVERSYEQYLEKECATQRQYRLQLEKKAGRMADARERQKTQEKAREFELTRCAELTDLYPGRSGRRY